MKPFAALRIALPLLAVVLAGTFAEPAFAQAGDAARLVPAEVRARGTLRVGSQQTFPPVEFREPGKTEVIGVSSELLDEVAKRLGLKLEYIQGEYASLISGVEADRFDVASGGISDTEEREQKLDFVNYMFSGGAMMTLADDAARHQRKTIDDFCGKSVGDLARQPRDHGRRSRPHPSAAPRRASRRSAPSSCRPRPTRACSST